MWWISKKKKRCKCDCHYKPRMIDGQLAVVVEPSHCTMCSPHTKVGRALRQTGRSERSKLIKEIDDVVSLIVRIKADWTCKKCHRRYEPEMTSKGLPGQKLMTTSHYFSRGDISGRWNFDNLDAMDIFCHQKVENHKTDTIEGFNYEQYMIEKLGKDKFERLKLICTQTTKYSTAELGLLLMDYKKQLNLLLCKK